MPQAELDEQAERRLHQQREEEADEAAAEAAQLAALQPPRSAGELEGRGASHLDLRGARLGTADLFLLSGLLRSQPRAAAHHASATRAALLRAVFDGVGAGGPDAADDASAAVTGPGGIRDAVGAAAAATVTTALDLSGNACVGVDGALVLAAALRAMAGLAGPSLTALNLSGTQLTGNGKAGHAIGLRDVVGALDRRRQRHPAHPERHFYDSEGQAEAVQRERRHRMNSELLLPFWRQRLRRVTRGGHWAAEQREPSFLDARRARERAVQEAVAVQEAAAAAAAKEAAARARHERLLASGGAGEEVLIKEQLAEEQRRKVVTFSKLMDVQGSIKAAARAAAAAAHALAADRKSGE